MEQPLIDLEEGKFQAVESEEIRMSGIFPEEEESSNARVLPFECNEPCIFRVHEGLRHVNPNAYTPMLVSIGPYHHGNEKFDDMEEHKKRYRHLLLERMNLQGKDLSLEAMKKKLDISKARNYYANSIGDFNEEQLAEMMLLDGCFVIEFLRKHALRDVNDPIFKASWMRIQICHDLMLLENQLPFFVLSQLFDMTETSTSECHPLLILAMLAILQVVPNQDSKPSLPTCETKHFLDLVHKAYVPSSPESPSSKTCTEMPCVMELQAAGVEFIKAEGQGPEKVSMFDIKFEHGQLKIPKFTVSDSAEIFFRNIIAYEQHSSYADHKYFTDFTIFMNKLINSEQDVNELRRRHIIDNRLGYDKRVVVMFDKLSDGTIFPGKYLYSEISVKVNAYCQRFWSKPIAKLRRDYLNNPWTCISTNAAVFLLILTVIQTVVSLITLLA